MVVLVSSHVEGLSPSDEIARDYGGTAAGRSPRTIRTDASRPAMIPETTSRAVPTPDVVARGEPRA